MRKYNFIQSGFDILETRKKAIKPVILQICTVFRGSKHKNGLICWSNLATNDEPKFSVNGFDVSDELAVLSE